MAVASEAEAETGGVRVWEIPMDTSIALARAKALPRVEFKRHLVWEELRVADGYARTARWTESTRVCRGVKSRRKQGKEGEEADRAAILARIKERSLDSDGRGNGVRYYALYGDAKEPQGLSGEIDFCFGFDDEEGV